MTIEEIMDRLEDLANPTAREGMARFGITAHNVYGVAVPNLRQLAKEVGRDHQLAMELWAIDSRETMILATMVEEPKLVTEAQAEEMAGRFSYWEICDQACMNLFEKTAWARMKCVEWSGREEEFVKRAGFVLIARLAVSDKKAPDELFAAYLPLVAREAGDPRDMVRKGVSWALRQIGKRNVALHELAVATAQEIRDSGRQKALWVANDALKELNSEAVKSRLKQR